MWTLLGKRPLISAALLTLIPLLGSGCAKIADPQPPKVRLARPGTDLAARQLADSVVLTLSSPEENTDGSPVTNMRSLEVLRTAENTKSVESRAPLPDPLFMTKAVRILSIPSSRFPDYLHEKQFVIEDKLLFPDKFVIYSFVFRYAVLFTNNHNQTAGLSNQVSITPVPIPGAPTGLSAKITESSLNLRWTAPLENMDGSKPARIAGYNIYKTENTGRFPSTPLNREPVQSPEFEDRSFEFDKTYYYEITVLGSRQDPFAESSRSEMLAVAPKDIFPPAAPKDFNALAQDGIILLIWSPSSSTDLAGYRIYRWERGTTGKQVLTELTAGLNFRDTEVTAGKEYEYSIKAIDTHGNESEEVIAIRESLK